MNAVIKEERVMNDEAHLYVLWTNDNLVTAEKMIFMYTVNSLIHGWWDKVTLIIWGAPAKLVSENDRAQELVAKALESGVHLTACKACADQLGVSEKLAQLDIEVTYWGEPLTHILKSGQTLLTI